MPEFRIEGSGKRISVDARHVEAVIEEDDNLSRLCMSSGVNYKISTSYETTIGVMKGDKA